jgi:hypothetical protein
MTPASSQSKIRKRPRGRRRPFLIRFWWLTLLAGLSVVAGGWMLSHRPAGNQAKAPPGYIIQTSTLDQEYLRFSGKALTDVEVRKQFEKAASLAAQGEYNGAILLLENISKKAAVPVVFNDMGLLYAQLDDRAHAIKSFRDALARDFEYAPVRQNLYRLRGFTSNSADPVSTELEPNNNIANANVIALDKPVEAEISQLDDDVDMYRVTSPAAPRDLIVIQVENRSKTLIPRMAIYDDEGVILPLGKEAEQAGGSLTQYLAPKPNTTLYLHISGAGSTSGAYTLSVHPLKAFDSYEPNDDIYTAHKIDVGQQIEANIMDENDTDFYSFVAPRTGTVSIDITGESATLIPALTTFGSDMRNSGFGPDVRTPGASLHHTLPVQDQTTYYIQVWSQGKSSGKYSLLIH